MIFPYNNIWPQIHETAFIAPSADVIGDVTMGPGSSIWFKVVVRGDVHSIRIGARTNIQDQSVLHVTLGVCPLEIGDEVTVGHGAILHGCKIGNGTLVGMGAIILDEAEIGEESIVGANALVTERKKFPPRSMILGSPAKVVRVLTDEDIMKVKLNTMHYVELASEYYGYAGGPKKLGENYKQLEDIYDLDEGELS